MKNLVTIILTVVLGIIGMILFFGDNNNAVILIISKPVGLMMTYASLRLYSATKTRFQ